MRVNLPFHVIGLALQQVKWRLTLSCALLSERELDVLRLIAKGMGNQQIAETLVIGEATVKTHVGNILGKLHLADRTQAAVFAWATGIVRR